MDPLTIGLLSLSIVIGFAALAIAVASLVVNAPASSGAITLTGDATGTGTDSIAVQVVKNANLTGEVTSVGNAATLANAAVISKLLTGFSSTAGTINSQDSLMSAIEKLDGNSTLPFGSVYTDSANMAFQSGVARLITPSSAVTGDLVDFTWSGGSLVYAGSTARQFFLIFTVSLEPISGTEGLGLRFRYSRNDALVAVTTQNDVATKFGPINTTMLIYVPDFVTLDPGDSIALVGSMNYTGFIFVKFGLQIVGFS